MTRPWSYDDEMIASEEQNAYRAWKLGMRTEECAKTCTCTICETPQYGAPGRDHCAACCYGTLIAEYDHECPIAEHRVLAHRQFGDTKDYGA